MSWCPTASLEALRFTARVRAALRAFFDERSVLEVQTPVLSAAAVSDPVIESFAVDCGALHPPRYLHTSPEFAMKRLLAAHAEPIWQLCPVFRVDERGRYHNPEFTLLEWYRPGFNHHDLMIEIAELCNALASVCGVSLTAPAVHRYGVCVRDRLGLWPEEATVGDVAAWFTRHGVHFPESIGDDLDAALVLFFDEFVVSCFPNNRLNFLIDYPVSQAALARRGLDEDGREIAERFELYVGEVELGNGFHELSDALEQRRRFEADNTVRAARGLPQRPLDEHLLSALSSGFPDCAGVAIGFERLLMWLGGFESIDKVMSFPFERA